MKDDTVIFFTSESEFSFPSDDSERNGFKCKDVAQVVKLTLLVFSITVCFFMIPVLLLEYITGDTIFWMYFTSMYPILILLKYKYKNVKIFIPSLYLFCIIFRIIQSETKFFFFDLFIRWKGIHFTTTKKFWTFVGWRGCKFMKIFSMIFIFIWPSKISASYEIYADHTQTRHPFKARQIMFSYEFVSLSSSRLSKHVIVEYSLSFEKFILMIERFESRFVNVETWPSWVSKISPVHPWIP